MRGADDPQLTHTHSHAHDRCIVNGYYIHNCIICYFSFTRFWVIFQFFTTYLLSTYCMLGVLEVLRIQQV